MEKTPGSSAGSGLSWTERLAILFVASAVIAATVWYLTEPPATTKVTTEKDASGKVTKTTTESQAAVGDSVLIAGFGLASVLLLTVLVNGRLKLTGPGGAGVELVAAAVASAADSTIQPLVRERRAAAAAGLETSPEVEEAIERWKDLRDVLLRDDET